MTYEEVKNLLKNIRGKQARLKAVLSYIIERRALIEGVGAVNYDKVSVKSSPGNSTEERYVREMDRLKDLQQRYDVLHEDLCKDDELIFELMKALDAEEYEVILNRYLRGLSPRKTAKLMNYSEEWVYLTQRTAIEKMSKMKGLQ